MLLLSLSMDGLDKLLTIRYQYSCKWRYDYVPLKYSGIVFNETKFSYDRHYRRWKMRPNVVHEDINCKHLSVSCNKHLNIDINIEEAGDKLKGTLMSLVNCGLIHSDGLHPFSFKKIYETVVLPIYISVFTIVFINNKVSLTHYFRTTHVFCFEKCYMHQPITSR